MKNEVFHTEVPHTLGIRRNVVIGSAEPPKKWSFEVEELIKFVLISAPLLV